MLFVGVDIGEPPAPMGLWNVALPTVIDTILKAFSEPLKDRIPAGHLADICSFFDTADLRDAKALLDAPT